MESRNCEYECDKSCDVGEYLDYENCKFRKKLVEKLVEECTENIDEVKITEITSMELHSIENTHKCGSCTMYIVLLSIIFTINIKIATYFVYWKYINRNKENISKYDYVYQATIY